MQKENVFFFCYWGRYAQNYKKINLKNYKKQANYGKSAISKIIFTHYS